MNFREKIKELCRERGITQKELADKLGISDISLNKTLRGEYPQLQTLERIAEVLEVQVIDLFEQKPTFKNLCPHCNKEIFVTVNK